MRFIFLGAPGSGKGTQAKMLADAEKIMHLSMGDMLRETVKSGSELGKKLENYLKNGLLVPDEVVNDIVRAFINGNNSGGFILDGYPRTVKQAEFLSSITDIDSVIYIDVPKEEIVKRLTGRLSCKNCGAVYHIVNKAPKTDNICDICSGPLYVRDDDKEETIKKRFEVYENETSPLINYYSGKVKKIKGLGSVADVFGAVKVAA